MADSEFAIPEEVFQSLPLDLQEEISEKEEIFGGPNKPSWDMAQAHLLYETERIAGTREMRAQPVTQAERDSAAAAIPGTDYDIGDVEVAGQEAYQRLINEGVPPEEAQRRVERTLRRGDILLGKSGVPLEMVREADPFEALLLSPRRQQFEEGVEPTVIGGQQVGGEDVNNLRDAQWREAYQEALSLADSRRIPTDERPQFIEEQTRNQLRLGLEHLRREIYNNTKEAYFQRVGITAEDLEQPVEAPVSSPLPLSLDIEDEYDTLRRRRLEGMTSGDVVRAVFGASGRPPSERSPPSERELELKGIIERSRRQQPTTHRQRITQESARVYDEMISQVYARDPERRWGREIVGFGAPEVAPTPTQQRRRRREEDDQSVKDNLREFGQGFVPALSKEVQIGVRRETLLGAGIRNVGAALSFSWFVDPMIRGVTWDRNPHTGLPYDENDPMYLLYLEQERAWREGTTAEKTQAYISNILSGGAFDIEPSMRTGNMLHDYALAHAAGQWVSDTIASQGSYQAAVNAGALPKDYALAVALGMEIMTPLKATAAGLAFAGTRGTMRVGARGASRAARGLASVAGTARAEGGLQSAARFFEGLEEIATPGKSYWDGVVFRQLIRNHDETLGLARKGGEELRGALDAAEYHTSRISLDYATRMLRVRSAEDLARVFPEAATNSELSQALNRWYTELQGLRDFGRTGNTEVLMSSALGRRALAIYETAADLLPKTASPNARVTVSNLAFAKVIEGDIRRFVANAVANDFVYVTPSRMVRRSSWLGAESKVQALTREVGATSSKTKDGEVFFRFTKAEEASEYAASGLLGRSRNPVVTKTLEKIKNGEWLSNKEYNLAIEGVKNGAIEAVIPFVVEGASIFSVGKGAKLAVGRHSPLARAAENTFKGIRSVISGKSPYLLNPNHGTPLGRRFKKWAVATGKAPKPWQLSITTPTQLVGWMDETAQILNQGDEAVSELIKQALRAEKGLPHEEQILAALNRVAKRYTKDPIEDYLELLELFFRPRLGGDLDDVWGVLGGNAKGSTTKLHPETGEVLVSSGRASGKPEIEKALRDAGLARGPVTTDGLIKAVSLVRESAKGSEVLDVLENIAMKQVRRGVLPVPVPVGLGVPVPVPLPMVFGLSGNDDLGSLLMGWFVMKQNGLDMAKAAENLQDLMPSFSFQIPTRAAAGVRWKLFEDMAKARGVPDEIIQGVKPNMMGTLGGGSGKGLLDLSRSDRLTILKSIVNDLFLNGNIAPVTEKAADRIFEAAMREDLLRVVGEGAALEEMKRLQGSFLALRRRLEDLVSENPSLGSVDDIERLVVPDAIKAVVGADLHNLTGQMMAMGVPLKVGKPVTKTSHPFIGTIPGTDDILIHDPRMTELFEKLRAGPQEAKMLAEFAKMRPETRSAWQNLWDTIDMTKRITVTGLLSGFPSLNHRYWSTNALGNGFIGAITNPEYALEVFRSSPGAAGRAFMRASARARGLPTKGDFDWTTYTYLARDNDVIFQDVYGKLWTKSAFDDALRTQRVRYSQTNWEFQNQFFFDMMRDARIGKDLTPINRYMKIPGILPDGVSPGRFWSFLRPDQRNVFTLMMEEYDNALRESVFARALRNGMDEAAAGEIGRTILLDYTATPAWLRRSIARHWAFFAFNYNMAVELGLAVMRDGKAFRNLTKVLQIQNAQRESMEEWVLEGDDAKMRLFKTGGKNWGRHISQDWGLNMPWSSQVTGFFNTIEFMAKLAQGEMTLPGAVEGLKGVGELALSDPRFGPLVEILNMEGDENAPHGYPPSWITMMAKGVPGAFDQVVDFYHLEIVATENQRPDLPLINGEQYQFGSLTGRMKWAITQEWLLLTGLARTPRDYATLSMAAFGAPEGVELRRFEDLDFLRTLLSTQTIVAFESLPEAEQRLYRDVLRELRAYQKGSAAE